MADETMYAWSNFEIPDSDDPGNPRKLTRITPGEEVSQEMLGVDDAEWEYIVEAGAARRQEYPDMGNFQGSPVEFRKAQLSAAAEGGYFDTQYGTVSTSDVAEIDASTGKTVEAGTNMTGPGNKELVNK